MFDEREMTLTDIGDNTSISAPIPHFCQMCGFEQLIGDAIERGDDEDQARPTFMFGQHDTENLSQPNRHTDRGTTKFHDQGIHGSCPRVGVKTKNARGRSREIAHPVREHSMSRVCLSNPLRGAASAIMIKVVILTTGYDNP